MPGANLSIKLVSQDSSLITDRLLTFFEQNHLKITADADYALYLSRDGFELGRTDDDKTRVGVDFNHPKTRWRQNQSELLHRATGITEQRKPGVLDATAGMGQDAFSIASRGSNVTMVEQHPLIYLLLQDGLKQSQDTDAANVTAGLTLIFADAKQVICEHQPFDVIYLDPMFPEKRSSAKTKKAMQLFREMVTPQEDESELLEIACANARHRVVIKRPVKAPPYANQKPDYNLKGRNVRYDIFGIRAF